MRAFCVVVGLAIVSSAATVQAEPVARWDFGTEEATPLTPHGKVQRDQAGPRPPEFPDMAASNTAVQLDASAYLSIPDTGPESSFDFTNGDAITLEAWVNPGTLREGEPRYIIGKGRTGSPHFAPDNQNWALRVIRNQDQVHLSFLFATKRSADGSHWHRWTSAIGFPLETGWHHLAVSYRFGDPDSIRGWIDGQRTLGKWDMGGVTKEPPVVDDDEIRIGTGFEGLLDAIAIHREMLDDKTAEKRFHRLGGPRRAVLQAEVMPDLGTIPEGRVLVQLCEDLPTHLRWLNEGETWPAESTRWLSDSFLLAKLPRAYDDWGIRSRWNAPLLVRLAADVDLPPGQHRILMRARALGRLWINGEVVARTEPITRGSPDGEEAIIPVAEPPVPGLRPHGYRQQEVFGEANIDAGENGKPRRCRVVLELVVGGRGHRTEAGEVCLALETEGGRSFRVLAPTAEGMIPLTDAAVESVLAAQEQQLARQDDDVRRRTAASQGDFWQKRHAAARAWAVDHAVAVPTVAGQSALHPVDAFVLAKIERATEASAQTDPEQAAFFHQKVLPVLRENCFRCHGEKVQGGLKLNSREAALKAGDSETPAVVPGDLDASELITRVRGGDMPPTGDGLSKAQIEVLEEWVRTGAPWPAPPIAAGEIAPSPVIDDAAFLRRVYLDVVGVPPTQAEAEAFLNDTSPDRRNRLIDRLLNDERSVDNGMSFWLDILAENPTLINASLNSTGPFRWFLYDSLRDGKPLDRMVTELLLMRGDSAEGGSAGFGIAAENDAPFAEKANIVSSAFLGVDLQCARCHDSPYHSTTQRDLFALSAMLGRKATTVPATSRVPAAFFERQERESLIRVTLKPDESIPPEWPFAEITGVADDETIAHLMYKPDDSRERLAALITSPQNQRFPRVIVNHLWKRLIGTGLVEPVKDWEGKEASHPELLDWLAMELLAHDYDIRHVKRLIMTSQLYQREAVGQNLSAEPQLRFFSAPERRRLTAEQIVDSLHAATGRAIDAEELTFVHDGRRPLESRLTLGRPNRAWMFSDLKNERDRPSLALPRARAVVDVLEAFGWTGARQKAISQRELDPNLLQPGVLANGAMTANLTRATDRSELAQLAIDAKSPAALVDALFLRFLTRHPTDDERKEFVQELSHGFESRLTPASAIVSPEKLPLLPQVTWFNHLRPEANTIQQEIERRVRQGPPPDPRLRPEWREAYEDVVWSLVNHREFVWIP